MSSRGVAREACWLQTVKGDGCVQGSDPLDPLPRIGAVPAQIPFSLALPVPTNAVATAETVNGSTLASITLRPHNQEAFRPEQARAV